MLKKQFCIFFWIFVALLPSFECYWIPFLTSYRQLQQENFSNEGGNETSQQSIEDENTSEKSQSYLEPTTTDLSNTTDSMTFNEENGTDVTSNIFESLTISEKNGSSSIEANEYVEEKVDFFEKLPDVESSFSQTYEEIVFQRSNCNIKMEIDETQSKRILVKFEPVKISSSGKCCITLDGKGSGILGVVVSDVHFLNSEEEVLRVFTNQFGRPLFMRQYYNRNEYQPLLLTESTKVFLVLYYNVKKDFKDEYSSFYLEVFCYRKQFDRLPQGPVNSSTHMKLNFENIYFTTEESLLANEEQIHNEYY